MDFHSALRTRLILDPMVGLLIGDRVTWIERPQTAALDAITLQVISDPRTQHLKGFNDLRETRVQLDCWSRSHLGATSLGEAAIAALVPEDSADGVTFNRAHVDAVRDLGEPTPTGFIHRTSVDLRVWWQQET